MLPILGKTSLVTVDGDYWRKVRKMFNPAFSVSHLETLIPGILEESMVFVSILEEGAKTGQTLLLGDRLPVISPLKIANSRR
jgi:cytochrome P450